VFAPLTIRPPPRLPPFPYTTLFRSLARHQDLAAGGRGRRGPEPLGEPPDLARELLGGGKDRGVEEDREHAVHDPPRRGIGRVARSEEHTSELQSRGHLVCRLLLGKK